jgi:hypothetical protein
MFFSSQEIHVKVRAVNGGMAPHTLSAGLEAQPAVGNSCLRMKSGVALQTQFPPLTPDQQHAIDASVGIVTGDTTFNLSRRMFVYKRTVLFDVALRAGFRDRTNQIEGVGRAVRIVTVRALHRTLGNPVMHG